MKSSATLVTNDAHALIEAPEIEIVIDATGHPPAGIRHALGASFRAAMEAAFRT